MISIGDVNESLDLYELEELSGIPISSSEGRELVPEIVGVILNLVGVFH